MFKSIQSICPPEDVADTLDRLTLEIKRQRPSNTTFLKDVKSINVTATEDGRMLVVVTGEFG